MTYQVSISPRYCRARLQLSKSQFRNKRSRADVIITVHPPTHQQLLKASRKMIFTLFQLTNQTRGIFHIKYCQAWVQVQGLSQISNKRPGPGACSYNCSSPPTHHQENFSEQNNIEISSCMN